MSEECLICGSPLQYLETDEMIECAICGRKELSKTKCIHGHYVCNECHMAGLDSIIGLCLKEESADPVSILEDMMNLDFCHMHGPEHHVMCAAALLSAYHNAGGSINLEEKLKEVLCRGKSVPGGACGFWGACGAAISSGIFISVLTGSTPLAEEPFALSNEMTSRSLAKIAETGGPRCCKRNSYLSILAACEFVKEHFGIEMKTHETVCFRSHQNNQCIGKRCPFSLANHPSFVKNEKDS